MNIFALDTDPRIAAQMHADKHVVKMITETAQILSTAAHVLDIAEPYQLYKPTHAHHPCVLWAAKSSGNYGWLVALLGALLKEYDHRYGKPGKFVHARALLPVFETLASFVPAGERTPFALAMPEDCQGIDPVNSYRRYYMEHKAHLHSWTNRSTPFWARPLEVT